MRAPKCAVPTFVKSAQFRQELETARSLQCLVYSQEPHFHVRDSSSIKIVGNLWTASATGWGWAVESESSQRRGGGGSAGEQGAGGVRETGEERARSGISTMGGKQDGNSKRQAFVVCAYHPVKETNPTTTPPGAPPLPTMKSGQCQDCKPHFYFFRSLVRWLLVYFLLCFFFCFCPSLCYQLKVSFKNTIRKNADASFLHLSEKF